MLEQSPQHFRRMQQLHPRLQKDNYVRHCRVTRLPTQHGQVYCQPGQYILFHSQDKCTHTCHGGGDRDRGGWLFGRRGEGRAWEAKYRLVQALKAVIRLAAAVAHPGRLAGRGTPFIQRVSG